MKDRSSFRCRCAATALSLALGVTLLAACGPRQDVTAVVTPKVSMFDTPVRVVIHGLIPKRRVAVELSSVDAADVHWASHALFRADASGTLNPASDPAIAGSYRGVNPMGLIDAMQPARTTHPVSYVWGSEPRAFHLSVLDHSSTIASDTFRRRGMAPGVQVSHESIAATGFYGQFWQPPTARRRQPAVLIFGGSEGGFSGQALAAGFASAGYPTLGIAYFKEPGLPSKLEDIPLEYFADALRWLARQPGVNAGRMYVAAGSRGSEAALLLGVYYPNLVHGVIASSPDNVSLCSYPGCQGPAWTLHGKPLPYTRGPGDTSNPAAVIPVQRIRGPILLVCGTYDLLWLSCNQAEDMQQTLDLPGGPYRDVLYQYQGAGHLVDGLIPYEPTNHTTVPTNGIPASHLMGNTPLANDNADARLWPRILNFLAHPTGRSGNFTIPATPPCLTCTASIPTR